MACFKREPTSRVPVISLTILCIIDKSMVPSSIVCYCHNSTAENNIYSILSVCSVSLSFVLSAVFHEDFHWLNRSDNNMHNINKFDPFFRVNT